MKNNLRTCFGWLAGLCLLATHSAQAAPVTGPSTSQVPYVEPMINGVEYASLLSAGESVGEYRMVGIPDGMGAFDNGNGTYTVVMNHELGSTAGIVRAHGGKGAFVSKWVIDKANFITIDEEHSGVIDMTEILGAGKYLYATQVHSGTPVAGPNQTELAEGGQLALMSISGNTPTLSVQPAPVDIGAGQSAAFSVTVSAGAQIQWYKNGMPIYGATGSSCNIPAATASEAAQYTAVVTDVNGSVASATVVLTLTDIAVYAGLVIAGPVNQEYQIRYANSLQEPVTWTNLESITLTQSPLLYIDQTSPGQAKRFYRAIPVTDR